MNTFLVELIISLLIVLITIFWTKKILKNNKARKIIVKNKFLHPNSISYFRIPLWLIAILLFHYWYEIIWVSLFTFASITDAVDWMVARACKLTTELWKSLDPLADKLVYFSPLLYFWIIWKINLYLVISFIVIDIAWQFSRIILKKLKLETKANHYWKFKTTFIFILIFYLMIFENKEFINLNLVINDILILFWIIFAILSILFKFIPNKKLSK